MSLKDSLPLFSIITVCLNEPNLERTCESIVNQSYQNFEWLVIDGGSDEKTLHIFEKYKVRMNYFVSEKDDGIYHAMNKGILQAKGKYCNFMNAGDSFYTPDVLERAKKVLEGEPEIDVLYGNALTSQERLVRPELKYELWEYLYYTTLPHQSTFIRNKCFEYYGLYDAKLKIASDYKYFLLLHRNECIFMYFDVIVSYMDKTGISSDLLNRNLLFNERKQTISEFYTLDEIRYFEQKKREFRLKLIATELRNGIKGIN